MRRGLADTALGEQIQAGYYFIMTLNLSGIVRGRRGTGIALAQLCVPMACVVMGIAALSFPVSGAQAQGAVPVVTGNARVDELLSRMTLAEKLSLIHDGPEDPRAYQGQAGYVRGVPRLGIPGLRLGDGPPGVLTRHPSQAETATMGVAASFDVDLARENGVVIGREARALGIDVSLQPFINIDRDLAFRRAYNTFGEDPLLTGRMGAAVIEGIQSQRVMAMAKHFVGYDTAGTDVWVDEQTLREVYMAPFEAAIQAGVASVMCSYNHINGPYACGDSSSLIGFLRDELGFKGFVTSDWGATHSALLHECRARHGNDRRAGQLGLSGACFSRCGSGRAGSPAEPNATAWAISTEGTSLRSPLCQRLATSTGGEKVHPMTIAEALKSGSVSETTVTRAAGHVLYEMDRFGFLDGRSKHAVTAHSMEANAGIIERTGEEAAVLLKNEAAALPLKSAELDSLVLIGPTAGQVDAIGISGERSLGIPERQMGPLEAMK